MSFVPLLATLDEDRRLDAEGLQSMALSKLEMSINQHLTEIAKNVGGSKWSSVEHSLVNEVAKLMDQYNAVLFKLADSRPAVQDRVESLKYPPFELQTFLLKVLNGIVQAIASRLDCASENIKKGDKDKGREILEEVEYLTEGSDRIYRYYRERYPARPIPQRVTAPSIQPQEHLMTTPADNPHRWPVVEPADADLFLKGDPHHLEKVMRLLTIKRSLVVCLDSIIEDVGKEGWHRKQARMVQRVQTLMRESNEIVDYFRDHAPHLPMKWPRLEPFDFKQFVWRTVRDDLGVEYKKKRAAFEEAKKKGEPLDPIIQEIKPRYQHLMRIVSYMNAYHPEALHFNLNDFDLAF
ncbi:hypothetical protein BKA70DRAFT_1421691 [Coprinopsis sp. MPI-PUGE-AT-0042]|nr:hypothetical protein BKA70DRAFT_1421691 [Coprinopsis sp. MPI-PUGE-AT-0042]